jgi:hypothetical protein
MQLIENKQIDTIYHEHFSYLSFTAVENVFKANGLKIFDVEELGTHGGSLRVYAQRSNAEQYPVSQRVLDLLTREERVGMCRPEYYEGFQQQANKVKNDFLFFLLKSKQEGKKIGAYGAAAKGNTLLNFAGVRSDLLPFIVDKNTVKQGKFMPGSRIPIVEEKYILEQKPDYIVIFPWNIRDEIMKQLAYVRDWGTKFVTAIPILEIL